MPRPTRGPRPVSPMRSAGAFVADPARLPRRAANDNAGAGFLAEAAGYVLLAFTAAAVFVALAAASLQSQHYAAGLFAPPAPPAVGGSE